MSARGAIGIAVALVTANCGPRHDAAAGRDAGPAKAATLDAAAGRPTEAPVIRRSRALMGTIFEILVADPPEVRIEPAMDAAFDEVARLEGIVSEWRPGSEVSRINEAAGRAAIRVSPELLDVIDASLRVAEASGGTFDPTWAALRGLWDFRSGHGTPPTAAVARERARLIDYRKVAVERTARTVRLARPGMALGLAGISKGYALDRAAAVLRARGVTNFVLYAGGQVLVAGRRGDRPWRVGIQHPRRPDVYFAYFSPGEGSVSTSGDYERFFVADGVRYHHLIDPRTGMPARGSVAVTVVAPRAIDADAWSTALFVLGPREGMAVARREGLEALFIDPEMNVTATAGIQRELTRTAPLVEGAPGSTAQR